MKKHLLSLLCLWGFIGMAAQAGVKPKASERQLPFSDNFTSAETFSENWTVINSGTEYCKWEFCDWKTQGSDISGCASCASYNGENDDWLVSAPLALPAGDCYVTFYAANSAGKTPELLDVCIGTGADASGMKTLASYNVLDKAWGQRVVNFHVDNAGTYYIAFHSKTADGSSLYIDNVEIDKGQHEVAPSLTAVKALLPYSNCALDDETRIGLRVTNKGTGDAKSFTISYSVNGGTTVTQTVDKPIAVDETADIYFDKTADFLDIASYSVSMSVECGGSKSSAVGIVDHYAPITDLPIVSEFYTNENVTSTWLVMGDNSWTFERMGPYYEAKASGVENGLLSHCITFNHPFRVKMSYTGGSYRGASGFYVAYGRPGTDPAGWKKVFEDNNVTGDKNTEFTVTPDEPGDYSLIIVDESSSDMKRTCIYETTISEIYDHDLRITGVESSLAPYLPETLANGKQSFSVTVENRGAKAMTNVKIGVSKDGKRIATSDATASIAPDGKAVISVDGVLDGMKKGDAINVSAEVEADDEDEYKDDNTKALPVVNVTDSVLAAENLEEFKLGTGANGSPISMGNVFHIAKEDVLTSVSFGLCKNTYYADDKVGVAVYSMKDDQTIDRCLFSTTLTRGGEAGLRTVSFTPRVLPAGKYFFEVSQTTKNMLALSYESRDDAVCYQNNGGILTAAPGAALAIRANFDHNAKAFKKNVAVVAITKPEASSALFSSDETIDAVVENLGSEEAKQTVLTLTAGKNVKEQKVDLLPYEKRTVSFDNVDLATPGEYTITVSAALDGDENLADNTLSRNVTSRVEASPYTLDFEQCNDFDTDHEFNPRWWTVNRTGDATDQFWRFNYPHKAEPVGFIAFNTHKTEPEMTDEINVPGFSAHSGERFGAAFARGYNKDNTLTSDSWLISPKLKLNGHSSLELYVKTHALESAGVELEKYRILISETDDNFDSFTAIGGDREAPVDWTKVTVDLSQYDNKDVYVAIQYVSTIYKGVVMMVDDIAVKTDGVANGVDGVTETQDVAMGYEDGYLTVRSAASIDKVAVYDATGKLVCQADKLDTQIFRSSLDNCQNGIYMIRVQTAAGTTTRKLVIHNN